MSSNAGYQPKASGEMPPPPLPEIGTADYLRALYESACEEERLALEALARVALSRARPAPIPRYYEKARTIEAYRLTTFPAEGMPGWAEEVVGRGWSKQDAEGIEFFNGHLFITMPWGAWLVRGSFGSVSQVPHDYFTANYALAEGIVP